MLKTTYKSDADFDTKDFDITTVLSDNDGKPYQFYLNKGKHT